MCSFDIIDIFWSNMVLTTEDFSWKILNNDKGAQCYWENGRFFGENIDLRALCFRE